MPAHNEDAKRRFAGLAVLALCLAAALAAPVRQWTVVAGDYWGVGEGEGEDEDPEGDGGLGQTPDQDFWGAGAPRRGGETAGGRAGDPSMAKEVWLTDTVHNMIFCKATVPGDWNVEGNVAWNPNMPLAAYCIWLRFTNPARGIVAEMIGPLGGFAWNEVTERYAGTRDGTFMTDTGMFMLKYRNAQEIMNEFIAPLVKKVNPRARILWVRDDPYHGPRMSEYAAASARSAAGVVQWHAHEGTAAAMLVEDGDRQTMFHAAGAGFVRNMPMNARYFLWEWRGLEAITVPGGERFTTEDFQRLAKGVVFNPQWQALAQRIVSAMQNRGSAVIVRINEQARAALRRSGDVMEKWAGKWSDHSLDLSNYVDPSGAVHKGPSSMNFGYVNATGDALVFSDREIGAANLHGYNELVRLD